jgi:hypothetical protein
VQDLEHGDSEDGSGEDEPLENGDQKWIEHGDGARPVPKFTDAETDDFIKSDILTA